MIAGVGSNDTRHAVKLTEAATAMRPDALLSVNPYYNRPSRRGIVAHFEAVNAATDLPIVLYNIPQRTGSDMPNDLLAELAQTFEHIVAVKQANPDNVAKIDGLQLYAGNDDLLATVLDLGEPGGILTGSHVFGNEMRRMVDEPERRHEIDAVARRRLPRHGDRAGACSLQGRAEPDRRRGRRAAAAVRRARRERDRGDPGAARAPRTPATAASA